MKNQVFVLTYFRLKNRETDTAKAGEPCQGGNAAALSHKLLGVSVFLFKIKKQNLDDGITIHQLKERL